MEVINQYVKEYVFYSSLEELSSKIVIAFWLCLPFLLGLSNPVNNESRYLILQTDNVRRKFIEYKLQLMIQPSS